ncbi:MAG: hypothetical protein RIQ81_333 [Pseudomonadota bacterium]|jgi:hypothetical protein
MKTFTKFFALCAVVAAPTVAFAAPGSGGGAGSRSFILTIPIITLTRDAAFRGEYNLKGATIAVEGATMMEAEEYTEDKMAETGDSMISKGGHVSVLLSRYSQPSNMSGWFWTLGAGVRDMKGTWKTNPSALALSSGMALITDDAGKVIHEYTARGLTAHARTGYRWVAQSIPLSIGGGLGLRHFDARFEDKAELSPEASAMSDEDKATLRRRYMTRLEPAIEFGLAF